MSALTRVNANLYFAPTAAVRSPRLSELDVTHAVAVATSASGDGKGEQARGEFYLRRGIYLTTKKKRAMAL